MKNFKVLLITGETMTIKAQDADSARKLILDKNPKARIIRIIEE